MGMRVSGLVSGMNTDEIIAKLMSANRIPLQKAAQQKQALEWRRDDYRSLNTKLMAFRDAAFNMKLQSNYLSKQVTSTNEAAISVTGSAASNEGRYSIAIDNLAKSAAITSGQLGGTGGAKKEMGSLGLPATTALSIGGDKGTAVIDIKTNDTVSDVVAKINGKSTLTGVKVTYDETMDRLFFVSSKTGSSSNISLEMESPQVSQNLLESVFKISGATESTEESVIIKGSTSFTGPSALIDESLEAPQIIRVHVQGDDPLEYTITSKTTIGQLAEKMNKDLADSGISVYVDSGGNLSLLNKSNKSISFTDDSDSGIDLVGKIGFDGSQTSGDPFKTFAISMSGENASVRFNGQPAVEYQSNTFTIANMTFTAKQVINDPVDIVVTQDVEGVFNAIKSFVEKYNELIDEVNSKTSEKKYRDFKPLTDEQRKDMKEEEIKLWEEKAKSGMLANDQMLQAGLSSFRLSLTASVTGLPAGQLSNLADIGISTSIVTNGIVSGSYSEKGKLYIDEAKLKKAISDNPDEVMNLFIADDKDPLSSDGDGIATRLHTEASRLINKITEKAGVTSMVDDKYSIGKELKEHDKRIDRLTRRMEELEKRYYKQFTAMETYLNRMNSQSAWLAQQFSTGG
ncbi:hypothetical protein PA598K_04732 [Paenibacillus sp. 598K]|uniref:flagellar filament capping protein FliD n=1 Tax=Paenibacillus sp. 598K TaxID=1117987 RepID=UPI000FFA91D4|nr:flagellar filament capping protein FliD [Paenibacillus sp. 598K]GBF76277.1 hypothetical protein PA598K_04732 [Paenibacillus sp. 598K]